MTTTATELTGTERTIRALQNSTAEKELSKERENEALKPRSISLTDSQVNEINSVAKATGMSASMVTRACLAYGLPALRRQSNLRQIQNSSFPSMIGK